MLSAFCATQPRDKLEPLSEGDKIVGAEEAKDERVAAATSVSSSFSKTHPFVPHLTDFLSSLTRITHSLHIK